MGHQITTNNATERTVLIIGARLSGRRHSSLSHLLVFEESRVGWLQPSARNLEVEKTNEFEACNLIGCTK